MDIILSIHCIKIYLKYPAQLKVDKKIIGGNGKVVEITVERIYNLFTKNKEFIYELFAKYAILKKA